MITKTQFKLLKILLNSNYDLFNVSQSMSNNSMIFYTEKFNSTIEFNISSRGKLLSINVSSTNLIYSRSEPCNSELEYFEQCINTANYVEKELLKLQSNKYSSFPMNKNIIHSDMFKRLEGAKL